MNKNIVIISICNIIKDIKLMKIARKKIFPDRPEEATIFGCESLSTEIFKKVLY